VIFNAYSGSFRQVPVHICRPVPRGKDHEHARISGQEFAVITYEFAVTPQTVSIDYK
jgi:hypothetical protein